MSAVLSVLALVIGLQPRPVAQAPSGHVILITIDGMRGDYLSSRDLYHLRLPALRRLMRDGSASERTLSVFPTLTGTAHTTLVTGVGAARHGILGNNRFDPSIWAWDRDNYDDQPPYRDFSEIKAETLWGVARARGLKTAAIGWPQTGGAPIDYRIDVVASARGSEARARTTKSASAGWFEAIDAEIGPIAPLDARMADHHRAVVGAEIIRRFRPAFMAVHFSQTDAVQHALGPGTPQALVAMEDTDSNVALIADAVAQTGLRDETTFVITGDHGFLPMHTQLAINLPLVEAGLVTKGTDGRPKWDAIVAPNRGLGSVYIREGVDRRAVASRAREAFVQYSARFPGRFRLLDRADLDRWGADVQAVFGIEPLPGYVLDARLGPPFAEPHNRAAGHGYTPDTAGMETGLILSGAGIRAGVVLPETRTLDVAPTIARLLGLDLKGAEGQPIVGALK